MTDFTSLRRAMVQGQIRTNDVTDPRLTEAMLELPRERFVPAAMAELTYLDRDLPVTAPGAAPTRCLLKPMTLAKLIQVAEVGPQDRILDVGCTTGYAAAVLARLGASVVALEEVPDLARLAERNLAQLGAASVAVVTGPLAEGWAALAPYDVILVEGRCEILPHALTAQLAPGGRLACVYGEGTAAKGTIFRRGGDEVSGRPLFEAAGTPLLPGFAVPPAFAF